MSLLVASVLSEAYKSLSADRISYFAYNADRDELQCIISKDIKGMCIPKSVGYVGQAFHTGKVVNAKEVQEGFKNNNQKLIDDFYQSYKEIVENINTEQFDELVKSKDLNWLTSKYLSTKLAFILKSLEPEKQTEVISDMISYASSSTKSSSVFIKVS